MCAITEELVATLIRDRAIGWWRGVLVNALVVINEVTLRRARLVLGWMTVCGRVNHLGICNQPPRSTQPDHPSVGRRN